jgi:hypothetical protein
MKLLALMCLCTLVSTWGTAPATAAEIYSYWVQPCTEIIARQSACLVTDSELARWALDAWQTAAGPGLRFEAAAGGERAARIRFYWLGGTTQLYGDARVMFVDGKRAVSIGVHPDLAQLGPEIAAAGKKDPLFRDTVVYLTCLHETGHAIGLEHTADFADIMYSFQYGGDILEYFSRYRRAIESRAGIRDHAGLSESDRRKAASHAVQ